MTTHPRTRPPERCARTLIGAVLLCAGFASTTDAAETVYGTRESQRCYELARFGARGASAITACTDALKSEELSARDRAATYSNRGVIHAHNGDHQRDLADQERALEIMPNLVKPLINRGNALMHLERYEEALRSYARAIEHSDERSAIAYYNRALLWQKLGNRERAVADLERAVELQPDNRRFSNALTVLK